MLKLESIEAFASIVETGSITSAARRLSELERVLSAKLVRRRTRTLALTDDGNTFYERAKRILRDVGTAASELAERHGTLIGPLRVSAPVSFGNLHLGPHCSAFSRRTQESS